MLLAMHRGYTVKLYPSQAQAELLDRHFGCVRFIYNEMIRINQKAYRRRGKGLQGYDMQRYLPKLKKQYPWLAEVNSQSLQIVCLNLADAYNRFFKKQGGFPKFKRKGQSESFTCISNSYFIEGSKLRLPKLGLLRYRGGDLPEGKVKRFTIRKTASGYFASALVETPDGHPSPCEPSTILGIDLGLTEVVITSDGQHVISPKHFVRSQAKLKRAQRALSRRKRGSARRARAKRKVARIHERVRNQRKDFNHKLARRLAGCESQAFAVESLNVKGMMRNRSLAKHIADCGWHQFLTFLRYKAESVGKRVIEVDRFFPSSKTCSDCGTVRQSLPLSIREWQCGDCGAFHHRDVNAAINIALEAARNVASERGGGVIPSVLRMVPANEARMCIAEKIQ